MECGLWYASFKHSVTILPATKTTTHRHRLHGGDTGLQPAQLPDAERITSSKWTTGRATAAPGLL